MTLHISDATLLDIAELGDHVARDSPRHAERLVERIFAEINRVGHSPLQFQVFDGRPHGFRRAVVDPYVIYFRVVGSDVFVERVLHGRRDAGPLLG